MDEELQQMQADWVKQQEAANKPQEQENTDGSNENGQQDNIQNEEVVQENAENASQEETVEESDKGTEQEVVNSEKPKEEAFFEKINRDYGSSFTSNEEVENLIKNKKSYEDLNEKIKEYEESLEKVREYTNPEKVFGSRENYVKYKISEKLASEGKNPDVVSVLMSVDINDRNRVNNLEAVVLENMINNSDLDEIEAAVIALDAIGVEIDGDPTEKEITEAFENLNTVQRSKLKTLSNLSRKNLDGIKNMEIPEMEDVFTKHENMKREAEEKTKERHEYLKKSWEPHYEKIRQATENIVITEINDGKEEKFVFPIEKEMLAKQRSIIENYMIQNDIEPTDDNISKATEEFKEQYIRNNWKKIHDASRKELRRQLTEKFIKETNNPTPFSTSSNNAGDKTDADVVNSQLKAFGIV